MNNLDHNTFIQDLESDTAKAESIARSEGLTFEDPLKAVHHYRNHGEDFPKIILKHGNTLEVEFDSLDGCINDGSNLLQTVELEVRFRNCYL